MQFFLNETDFTVTIDAWRIALYIDIRTYQEIISTPILDLLWLSKIRKNLRLYQR